MITAPPRKLVAQIAKQTGVRRSAVESVLIAAFETIKEEAAESPVMIRGFGTFHTATRAGCVRPSPSDVSKMIKIPPTKRLALRSPADRLDEGEG
jgi:nucleoid DNA-binding protein